jgi:hypothetical protein
VLNLDLGILFASELTQVILRFHSKLVNARKHLNGECLFFKPFWYYQQRFGPDCWFQCLGFIAFLHGFVNEISCM